MQEDNMTIKTWLRLSTSRIASLFLSVFLSVFALNTYADSPINVIVYDDYPPYLYQEDDQPAGLYYQIVTATLTAMGQPYTTELLPFKRGLQQASEGNGIMIGILKNQARAKTLDFSDAFYQEKITLYSNKEDFFVNTLDDLKGFSIGTLLGWSYGEKFDNAKEAELFTTISGELDANFNVLSKGWLDAVIHTELSAIYVLKNIGLEQQIFTASKPLELVDIRFGVAKGSHQDLLERFNQKLIEPEHKAAIDELIKQYK